MKHWNSLNFISLLLLPVTGLFCTLVTIRRILYRVGWFKTWQAPVPVIVVGNISVGGTGKTPIVIALLDFLTKAGFKPGVVSRGYGSDHHEGPLHVTVKSTAKEAGDEAVMIYKRTGCAVCVDENRSRAIRSLLSREQCDVVISDDGLQHYAMGRNFELVIVDEKKQYGNRLCLPSGPLREPVSRINQSDFILVNRQKPKSDDQSFMLKPARFISLGDVEDRHVDAFSSMRVHAVAGTASPQRFFDTLDSLGIETVEHVFKDHYDFSAEDFKNMQDLPIIMTEKDSVKCSLLNLNNAWYLSVSTDLPTKLCDKLLQMLET